MNLFETLAGATKPQQKDVFIKDDGDIITVGFQSLKSKKVIENEKKEIKNSLYGNELPKLDLMKHSKQLVYTWLISHGLSWEEC